MPQTLTILVSDQNQFFREGLRQNLLGYFSGLGIKVNITENLLYKYTADVIFLSAGTNENAIPLEIYQRFFSPRQCVFIIEENNQQMVLGDNEKGKRIRSISRKWAIGNILILLKAMLSSIGQEAAPPPEPAVGDLTNNALSAREYEVMRYLSLGINPGAVGRHLKISEKTVSAHKRTVMRKLNLIKNIELNYWLLNGGLNFVRVYRQPTAYRPISLVG
ncbi:transcriptional regulator NarL [Serratia quinivorans]|nr:transcriptional regulator NarL [Serratia quinivorans]CAI1674963.1 transcriptional regulator NarL [Serratia quinivorans]